MCSYLHCSQLDWHYFLPAQPHSTFQFVAVSFCISPWTAHSLCCTKRSYNGSLPLYAHSFHFFPDYKYNEVFCSQVELSAASTLAKRTAESRATLLTWRWACIFVHTGYLLFSSSLGDAFARWREGLFFSYSLLCWYFLRPCCKEVRHRTFKTEGLRDCWSNAWSPVLLWNRWVILADIKKKTIKKKLSHTQSSPEAHD